MRSQPERSVLITDAARSQDDQLKSRQKRYIAMMSGRVGCLILGAILISVRPPLLALWLSLCALGMVVLPWTAVLLANDRPPKAKRVRMRSARQPRQRALLPEPPDEDTTPRTIDVEP